MQVDGQTERSLTMIKNVLIIPFIMAVNRQAVSIDHSGGAVFDGSSGYERKIITISGCYTFSECGRLLMAVLAVE